MKYFAFYLTLWGCCFGLQAAQTRPATVTGPAVAAADSAAQDSTAAQKITGQNSTALHSTAPYSAAQDSVTQNSSAPHTAAAADAEQLKQYFFAAARTGDTVVLHTFLQAGFPVNERSAQSYTALMIASYAGQSAAVDLLLQHQADACLRDKRGHTALMGAMVKAEWAIARTLYATDCDRGNQAAPTDPVSDKNQMTAAQFAEVFGQSAQFKALAQPPAATKISGQP